MNTVNRGEMVRQVEGERKQMMRNATKYVPILLRCCFCCVSPSPVRVSLEEGIFRVLVIRHVHFANYANRYSLSWFQLDAMANIQ